MNNIIFRATVVASFIFLCVWAMPVMGKVGQGNSGDIPGIDMGGLENSLMDRYDYVSEMYDLARQADRDTPYYESDVEYYEYWVSGLEYEKDGDYEAAIDEYESSLEVELYEMITYEPLLDLGRVYLRTGDAEEAYDCFIKYIYHSEPYVSDSPYGGEVTEWGLSEDAMRTLNANRSLAEGWIWDILDAAYSGRPEPDMDVIESYLPDDAELVTNRVTHTPETTYVITSYVIDVSDEYMQGETITNPHYRLMFGEIDENGYEMITQFPLSETVRDGSVPGYTMYFCSDVNDVKFATWVDGGEVVEAAVVSGATAGAGTNLYAPFLNLYKLMPGDVEEIEWDEAPAPGKLMYDYSLTSRGLIFWVQNPETEWWAEEYTVVMYEYYYYDGMMRNYGLIESGNIFTPETFPTEAPTYGNDWMF